MRVKLNPPFVGRRRFLRASLVAAGGAAAACASGPRRKFFTAFVPGSLGVKADQALSIELAARHGFDSVQPFPRDLARDGIERHVEALDTAGLRWAAAGLAVNFRSGDVEFEDSLGDLPQDAAVLERAGVERMGTWLRPSSETLTYLQNFRRTASRLRRVAEILGEHGLRLGLEYVGTKRNWTASRHSFVHTMAGTKELIAEIDLPNVGFVAGFLALVDLLRDRRPTSGRSRTGTWCQRTSMTLRWGIDRDDQFDNRRELPLATGVIAIREFLEALVAIGYDGPVRAEPFSKKLNELDDNEASRLSGRALDEAFALVS